MMDRIHELTMLYLQNSIRTLDLKNPEEYATAYTDAYKKIGEKLKELSPKATYPKPRAGLVKKGLEFDF